MRKGRNPTDPPASGRPQVGDDPGCRSRPVRPALPAEPEQRGDEGALAEAPVAGACQHNQGVAEAIRRAGSQKELARLLGVTQVRVSRYLHGVRLPIRKALIIEQKLGVPGRLTRPDVFGGGPDTDTAR